MGVAKRPLRSNPSARTTGRGSSKGSAKGSGKERRARSARGTGSTDASPGQAQPEMTPAEAGMLDLQKWAGNRQVAALVTPVLPPAVTPAPAPADHRLSPSVQRQPAPAVTTPPATDPDFDKTTFVRGGSRFDTTYVPKGPSPAQGEVTVTLRVHVDFQNFTRADMRREPWRSHRFTRAQLADFAWTPAERIRFAADFTTQVQNGWSGKHLLATKDPAFAPHEAKVVVKVEMVDDASKAHNTMTALKVPKGKATDTPPPRFRSFVQGSTSTLEGRDVSEDEQFQVRDKSLKEQVAGFAHGKSELTPDLEKAIDAVAAKVKARGIRLGKVTTPDRVEHEFALFAVGRATTPGSRSRNATLADARAKAVLDHLNGLVGWGAQGQVVAPGEKNTTEDEKFRRVDLIVVDMSPAGKLSVTQNTAAHEAGHMFGLGDEYMEEDAKSAESKKFIGDKPTHYGDVEAQLGTEAADEAKVDNTASIMSHGHDVLRAHYVPFLTAVESMTKKDWTVR